jgi:hypothetical protein
MAAEIILIRQKPARRVPVLARVKGYNDTHVLIDVKVGNDAWLLNQSRPIRNFMVDYGLD